jgi:hypothetical protein
MTKPRAAWPVLCSWLLLGQSACHESSQQRASDFLAARGLQLPKTAANVGFVEDDQLRSIEYRIRFDLAAPDDAAMLKRLWCAPSEPQARDGSSKLGRAQRRSSDAELTGARYCDTDGPFDGQYHFAAIVGRAPSGNTRFLLSSSD